MNISTEMDRIGRFVYFNGFVSTFEKSTAAFISLIDSFCIAVEGALHSMPGRLGAILAQQQVIMIGHQTIGQYTDVEKCDILFQPS